MIRLQWIFCPFASYQVWKKDHLCNIPRHRRGVPVCISCSTVLRGFVCIFIRSRCNIDEWLLMSKNVSNFFSFKFYSKRWIDWSYFKLYYIFTKITHYYRKRDKNFNRKNVKDFYFQHFWILNYVFFWSKYAKLLQKDLLIWSISVAKTLFLSIFTYILCFLCTMYMYQKKPLVTWLYVCILRAFINDHSTTLVSFTQIALLWKL